jgi:hypothetical protein
MTQTSNNSLSGLLRRTIGDRLAPDAEDFLAMCADDIVWEFPFATPGGVHRLEGKAAVASYLPKVAKLIKVDGGKMVAVHRSADPDIAIIEFEVTGTGAATGLPYNQRYICVFTTRDGKIVHFKDYWNPLTLLEAVGGDEALASALHGDAQ